MPTKMPEIPCARFAFLQLSLGFVAYEEIFAAIAGTLRAVGAQVRIVATPQDADPQTDDALLIIGAPGYYSTLLSDLATLRARQGNHVRVLFWQLEHVPDPEMPGPVVWAYLAKSLIRAARHGGRLDTTRGASYLLLRRMARRQLIDELFLFTQRGADFLSRHGVPAHYLPLGHHPIWGTDQHRERDIDVLFLGEVLDDRRSRIVKAIRAELAAVGISLKTMYDFNPIGIWGEERNALLNRAKIYLCVYRHPSASSGLRFSLGMGNGALVVSEPVADAAPFVAGEHFVEAAVPDLAQTILTYLKDDRARERICQAAHRQIEAHYEMRTSATRLTILSQTPPAHDA